jgi:hypothetical protein
VKLEILDGPLAGIFTFSDPDMGDYLFDRVPPGLIHVQASAPWLQSQTLAVVIQGETSLDFVMQSSEGLQDLTFFSKAVQLTTIVIGPPPRGWTIRNR